MSYTQKIYQAIKAKAKKKNHHLTATNIQFHRRKAKCCIFTWFSNLHNRDQKQQNKNLFLKRQKKNSEADSIFNKKHYFKNETEIKTFSKEEVLRMYCLHTYAKENNKGTSSERRQMMPERNMELQDQRKSNRNDKNVGTVIF